MASKSGSGSHMYGRKSPMNGGGGRRGDRWKRTDQAPRRKPAASEADAVVEAGRGSTRSSDQKYQNNGTSRYHRGITSDSGSLSASTGSYGRGDTYRSGTRPCRSYPRDSGHASRSWKSGKPHYTTNESEPMRRQQHRHQRLPVTKVHIKLIILVQIYHMMFYT